MSKQNNKLISELTVADLMEIIRELQSENKAPSATSPQRFVYGVRGVEDLFGCSHKTAQYIKDHVICEAVSQRGRKIVIDADLALKLFNERRTNNGK